jgi:hypothetical protein
MFRQPNTWYIFNILQTLLFIFHKMLFIILFSSGHIIFTFYIQQVLKLKYPPCWEKVKEYSRCTCIGQYKYTILYGLSCCTGQNGCEEYKYMWKISLRIITKHWIYWKFTNMCILAYQLTRTTAWPRHHRDVFQKSRLAFNVQQNSSYNR